MEGFFLSLLDRSFSASLVVLIVMGLRLVLGRGPKWLHCALWALVAFRLVCPVSIESSLSLMPEREMVQSRSAEITARYASPAPTAAPDAAENVDTGFDAPASGGISRSVAPTVVEEKTEIHWPGVGTGVWLAGMGLMFGYAAVSFLRLRRKVSASIALSSQVYLCDYIDSPFILGIVKPRIYLPSEMDPRDAAHVLAHERAHLRRRDHWWKPLGFGLLIVYWFNPVLWVAYSLLCRDIELACDEYVVKGMALPDKKDYSVALLKCSVPRHMILACPLAFGEVGVKQRIQNVLHYRKPAFWVVVLGVMVSLIAGVCFLTDPVVTENEADDVSTEVTEAAIDASAAAELEELKDFDWNIAADALIPGEYTLFDPLYFEDYLFIGCQGPVRYYVLSFREHQAGSYVFEEALTARLDAPNQSPPREELLTVFHETEERDLALYIITEEAMTGLETYAGIWNYHHIDHWPALLVFDKADWGTADGCHFRIRYETPQTIGLSLGQNGDSLQFHEAQYDHPERKFLYSGEVIFDDGFHMSGWYYLEEADISKLLDILVGLPQEAFVPGEGPEEGIHATQIYLGLDDGMLLDKQDILLTMYTREDAVILGIGNRNGSESSFYDGGSEHFFTVHDPELSGFLLSLCDSQRRAGDLLVYNPEKYVTYSHEDAEIQVASVRGWEYEIVEYTDDATPFGIRARPSHVDEGWIFYSCWPDGFSVGEGYGELSGAIFGGGSIRVWYPAEELEKEDIMDSIWSYRCHIEYPESYVVVNEGADEWLLKYDSYLDCAFGIDTQYTQCGNPMPGYFHTSFGTNKKNMGYLPILDGWMSSGWDNDAIPYDHLFRFWPEGQLEGFISFAYIEGGFTPEEGLAVDAISLSEPLFPVPAWTATAEGAGRWQYLWIDVEGGSYLFRSDGTDHWTDKQWQEAMELISGIVIAQYDVPQ